MKIIQEKIYKQNYRILKSLIGLQIISIIQEQYFYYDKLDNESMGALEIEFNNEDKITIDCHGDAETILISENGLNDKTEMENSSENMYKWKKIKFLSNETLLQFGKIIKTEIELMNTEYGILNSGCRIYFQNGDFFHLWTIPSDNIFYGINEIPAYYNNESLDIVLKEIIL